jgi:hypothetical protein
MRSATFNETRTMNPEEIQVPTPIELLGSMITAANAEQLRTQAMLQTLIAVMLTDEQRETYNSEVGKTLKKLLKSHVEAYPQLYDAQQLLDKLDE